MLTFRALVARYLMHYSWNLRPTCISVFSCFYNKIPLQKQLKGRGFISTHRPSKCPHGRDAQAAGARSNRSNYISGQKQRVLNARAQLSLSI